MAWLYGKWVEIRSTSYRTWFIWTVWRWAILLPKNSFLDFEALKKIHLILNTILKFCFLGSLNLLSFRWWIWGHWKLKLSIVSRAFPLNITTHYDSDTLNYRELVTLLLLYERWKSLSSWGSNHWPLNKWLSDLELAHPRTWFLLSLKSTNTITSKELYIMFVWAYEW